MSYLLRLYPKSFKDISTEIRLATFFEAAIYECSICTHQGEIYSLDKFANCGFQTCTMTCPCCGEIKLNESFVSNGLIIRTDYPDEAWQLQMSDLPKEHWLCEACAAKKCKLWNFANVCCPTCDTVTMKYKFSMPMPDATAFLADQQRIHACKNRVCDNPFYYFRKD